MAKTSAVSLRLEPELDDKLAAVAAVPDRPKSWVIEQAIREFVELQAWQLAAIDEGIADGDAGRLVPHERVVAWVGSWGAADELPMPECE